MGVKSTAATIWEVAGYALAAYTMYQKLQEINAIKNDIFPYLSADQQAYLAKYIGAPAPVQPLTATAGVVPIPQTATTQSGLTSGLTVVANNVQNMVQMQAQVAAPSPLQQLKAGT